MADVPLGLVGDGTIDEVEADEQHAVVKEREVLLPSQLTGDGKSVGEVVLEAVEVLHPVVKGGVGVGTFVPVLVARQDEDRGPARRLEDGAGTLVHGLGARGGGGQPDVAEVDDELGIVGQTREIARQLVLLGIVVRDVTGDVERDRFADVPVIGRGGAVGIGPAPVAKGGTIQRPDDGGQCHEDDGTNAQPLATLPTDLLGDEVVARMEVVGWFRKARAVAEVDPRRLPSPRRRRRLGRISRHLHLVLVGIVPGAGGRAGRTAGALHVVGRGTEHARGAPTAGGIPHLPGGGGHAGTTGTGTGTGTGPAAAEAVHLGHEVAGILAPGQEHEVTVDGVARRPALAAPAAVGAAPMGGGQHGGHVGLLLEGDLLAVSAPSRARAGPGTAGTHAHVHVQARYGGMGPLPDGVGRISPGPWVAAESHPVLVGTGVATAVAVDRTVLAAGIGVGPAGQLEHLHGLEADGILRTHGLLRLPLLLGLALTPGTAPTTTSTAGTRRTRPLVQAGRRVGAAVHAVPAAAAGRLQRLPLGRAGRRAGDGPAGGRAGLLGQAGGIRGEVIPPRVETRRLWAAAGVGVGGGNDRTGSAAAGTAASAGAGGVVEPGLGLGQPLLNVGRHELEGRRLMTTLGRRRRRRRTGVDRRRRDHARLVVVGTACHAAAVLGAPRSVASGHCSGRRRRGGGGVGTYHRAGCRGTAAAAAAAAVARRKSGAHTAAAAAAALGRTTPTAAPAMGRVGRDEAGLVVGRGYVAAAASRGGGEAAVGRIRRQVVPLAAGVSTAAHFGRFCRLVDLYMRSRDCDVCVRLFGSECYSGAGTRPTGRRKI